MTIILNTSGQGSSSGPRPVPNVIDDMESAAREKLEKFGFTVAVVQVPGIGTPGKVYGQQPRADDIVPPGSQVRIFVIAETTEDTAKQLKEIKDAFDQVGTRVNLLETDDAAEKRYRDVIARLDEIKSHPSQGATSTGSSTGSGI